MSIDQAIFQFVQTHLQQDWLQYIARDITSLGGDTLTAAITVFVTGVLWLSGDRRSAASFAGTMLLTAAIIVALKLLIGRPCPLAPDPYQHHMCLDFPTSILSIHLPCMPSGHTCGSTVLYHLILLLLLDSSLRNCGRAWLKAWLLTMPPLIATTRILLSAHWFSDVVAGYGLGWGIVGVSWYAQRRN